jgi:hypothetical protein
MLEKSRFRFVQWLTTGDPSGAPTELVNPDQMVSPIDWEGSNQWSTEPKAINEAQEYLEAGKLITFRIFRHAPS